MQLNVLKRVAIGSTLAFGLVLGGTAGVIAQDAEPAMSHPAYLQAGDCAELDDNPVGTLNNLEPIVSDSENEDEEATDVQGVLTVAPVVYSLSDEVEVPFEDMLAESHSITVRASDDDLTTTVVCGEVGGAVVEGELVIALHSVNDSGYNGIAILTEDGDGNVDFEVYVAGPPMDGDSEPDATPAS